jgi:hypothetical protein
MTPRKLNAIITVVDRFTKMVVLIPHDSSISGVEVAKLLVEKVFCKFGFAGDLVSDRDSRFTSGFYAECCAKLGIHQSLSSSWDDYQLPSYGTHFFILYFLYAQDSKWLFFILVIPCSLLCHQSHLGWD